MTVHGIDVSFWNMWENEQAAWDQGARFVFFRLGSINNITGECYQDFNLEAYLEMIAESPNRWAYGGYWFWRLNHSAQKQADYIAGLIEMAQRDYGMRIRVMAVDDEIPAYFTAYQTAEACRIAEATAPVYAILYSNLNVWRNYRTGDKSAILDYDYWPAQWGTSVLTEWEPYRAAGLRPVMWQYSANGNGLGSLYGNDLSAGGTHDMDLNTFFGTEAEMYEFFDNETEPELPARVRIAQPSNLNRWLNVYNRPGFNQDYVIGILEKSSEVDVIGHVQIGDPAQGHLGMYEVRAFIPVDYTEPVDDDAA